MDLSLHLQSCRNFLEPGPLPQKTENSKPKPIARSCGRQRWHVQRLANVASGIGAAGVMVERRTRNEVQQRQATQYGQRAPHAFVPENSPERVHTPIASSVYQLRRAKNRDGCTKPCSKGDRTDSRIAFLPNARNPSFKPCCPRKRPGVLGAGMHHRPPWPAKPEEPGARN